MNKTKKQYKLLKRYTGLPDDWEVGDIVVKDNSHPWYYTKEKDLASPHRHLEGNMAVENNPEFWELCLNVPLKTKFKVNDIVYTIDKIVNSRVVLTREVEGQQKDQVKYSIETVNSYFSDGTWVLSESESENKQ